MADYGTLADYLAQNMGLSSGSAIASDVPAGASALSSLLPSLSAAGPYAAAVAALAELGFGLADIFGGGRSSTGPGSATADIAGAASSSDPVIALLGESAGALGGNTPISSPSAGPTSGPYFDVARKLEDLLRWGPGGLSDPKAEALDATTLKNAMHELGNPGGDTSTLLGLQNAFTGGINNLTPQNINMLRGQMDTQEQNILNNILSRPSNGGNVLNIPGNSMNYLTGNSNYQLPSQGILTMASLAPLMALMNQGSRFSAGWTVA